MRRTGGGYLGDATADVRWRWHKKKKKKQVGPKRFPFNSKNDCSFRQTKMYSSPVISVKKVTKKVLLQFRVERLRHFPKKLKNR